MVRSNKPKKIKVVFINYLAQFIIILIDTPKRLMHHVKWRSE